MTRTITNYEMQRRKEMAHVKLAITDAMAEHELTAMEWVNVLNEVMQRMICHGLSAEWSEETEA